MLQGLKSSSCDEVKKEIDGSILHGNILCVANGTIAAVPDSAVLIDSSHIGIVAAAHGAIALDFADKGIIVVSHGSVAANGSNQPIAAVTDVAIATDAGNVRIAAVPHGAVTFDSGYHRVVLVTYRLSLSHLCSTHSHEKKQSQDNLDYISH